MDNKDFTTVFYTVLSEKIGTDIRIALVADLHSCRYGLRQRDLLLAIDKASPDIVLLGGDIVDDRMPIDAAQIFLEEISRKYICYYVTGNHEHRREDFSEILAFIRSKGIKILDGCLETAEIGGQKINICGVSDPLVTKYAGKENEFEDRLKYLSSLSKNGRFTVLLSHHPERVKEYGAGDFDLVLSGHAHGGQWRIPKLINGIFAPHQGFFPKYAGGRYDIFGTTLIVSRGLAKESTWFPRIFNPRELVIVTLAAK